MIVHSWSKIITPSHYLKQYLWIALFTSTFHCNRHPFVSFFESKSSQYRTKLIPNLTRTLWNAPPSTWGTRRTPPSAPPSRGRWSRGWRTPPSTRPPLPRSALRQAKEQVGPIALHYESLPYSSTCPEFESLPSQILSQKYLILLR